MNVLTVPGRIVEGPAHRRTPDGECWEFRLAVDAMPESRFVVRATATTVTSGGTPTMGSRVTVTATIRPGGWTVRDGARVDCWSIDASSVRVLDGDPRSCSRPLF